MIEILPAAQRPISALRKLTDIPFEAQPFKRACEELGAFDPAASDDHLWMFTVAPDWPLLVAIDDDGLVDCAIFSFCWFPVTHDVSAADAEQFDAVFAEERARAVEALGRPLREGRDDHSGHLWAVWQGSTGLLVLQQSEYDLQIGEDLNYWIKRWSGDLPAPTGHFLDRLMNSEAK